MVSALQKPLSEEEIEHLEALLLSDCMPKQTMNLSALDGYITAIVLTPQLTSGSDMVRWIWDMEKGIESPDFESLDQAKEIMSLLMRYWNQAVRVLRTKPELFAPTILVRIEDDVMEHCIDYWCIGFFVGMQANLKQWYTLQEEHPEWFHVFLAYGTDKGRQMLEQNPISEDKHLENVDSIAENILHIYHYWHGSYEQPQKVAKTGRNEPCPCGSGKKYKHCHYLLEDESIASTDNDLMAEAIKSTLH